MDVAVACEKPDEIRVTITASATLGEWREISRRVRESDVRYYDPLDDLLNAIHRAVLLMDAREPVKPARPVSEIET